MMRQQDQDAVSLQSKQSVGTKYKKYNIKDYNSLQQNIKGQKMGGLGANIGGEQWEMAKRKKEIQLQYANNLKSIQAAQPLAKANTRSSRFGVDKDKTARERALEFAKNVPKPKITRNREENGAPISITEVIPSEPEQHDYY